MKVTKVLSGPWRQQTYRFVSLLRPVNVEELKHEEMPRFTGYPQATEVSANMIDKIQPWLASDRRVNGQSRSMLPHDYYEKQGVPLETLSRYRVAETDLCLDLEYQEIKD